MKFFIDTANLDQIKEARDLGILDEIYGGHAEVAGGAQKVVLNFEQCGANLVRPFFAEQQAEAGIPFIDLADAVNAPAVLCGAAAIAEAGGAGIAGAGDDFGQAVALAFGIEVFISCAHGALLLELAGLY